MLRGKLEQIWSHPPLKVDGGEAGGWDREEPNRVTMRTREVGSGQGKQFLALLIGKGKIGFGFKNTREEIIFHFKA